MACASRAALLSGVAIARVTGSATPNASLCEVESCVVSPTDCASRPECQGCGDLCFGSDPQDPGYDLYLKAAGLSLQASASSVWDGSLAGGDDGPQCSKPAESRCFKGSGDLTIATWPIGSAQAKSQAACCAACSETAGCKAWQLITKASATDPQCWAMAAASVKKTSPDSCVSAALPTGPAPLDGGLLRSADVILNWKDVQPQPPPAPYDWSVLAGAVERAYANNGTLMMLLWAGASWAPSWLYDLGIEKVATSKDGKSAVPNYLDPAYQRLLKDVHLDLARELRSLRPKNRAFVALQPCVGSTGDDTPFHEDSFDIVDEDLNARIRAAWPEFFRNISLFLHHDAFAEEVEANEMVLLINAQGESFPLDWVKENLPGSFIKLGHTGHAFQTNYERYRAAEYAPFLYSLQNGRPIRSRAELSGETCWVTGDICSPPREQAWNFYAMSNFVATVHLDFWNVQPGAGTGILDDTAWAPVWRLLNRYSGVRWARQSPGAWIAFRDGLDAMDTDRFDVETYGPLLLKPPNQQYPEIASKDGNMARAKAICAELSDRGCTIEDESALLSGPMKQRRANGTNDVAFGDWRGDYGGFVRLIAPEANTRGWWRLGSDAQMYGRFSRGFADPHSEGAVFPLALDRGLWGGLPLNEEKETQLVFRLLFLDRGTGVFTVHYDSQSGSKRLASVQKSGGGSWRELCATIADGRFDGGGPQGADIWLRNNDTEDDVFGGLEVADASIQDISLNGCDWQPGTMLV